MINTQLTEQTNRVQLLTEMFPLIPENLFEPVLSLDNEKFTDVIIDLTNKEDNLDIMECLMQFPRPKETNCESEDENVSNFSDRSDEVDVECSDDDNLLAKIEQESVRSLVLGSPFLKEAHKQFAAQCGLEFIDMDNMPPEITEMRWQVPETLALALYRAFFQQLGLVDDPSDIDTDQKQARIPSRTDNNMTMREIIELESALACSIEVGKHTIREDDTLTHQIEMLQTRYPYISRDELEHRFIACNMDTMETITDLMNQGHSSSHDKIEIAPADTAQPAPRPCNRPRVRRLERHKDIEQNRLRHLQTRLDGTKRHGLHSHAAAYYRDELGQCRKRVRWFDEQISLATVAQQNRGPGGERQLDLHGLTRVVALAAVQQRIVRLRHEQQRLNHVFLTTVAKDDSLTIICGRGLHSLHGRPRLKPAVRHFLDGQQINYSQPFDGVFRVPLAQFRRARPS